MIQSITCRCANLPNRTSSKKKPLNSPNIYWAAASDSIPGQRLEAWKPFRHRACLLGALDLLLLLPSRFSRVWLCATPETAAHQAPPSLGFSRQEHWSGLPFPSPMHEREKWKWTRDPMDCSLPGSSVHGIFQARVLEWGATAFSISIQQTDKKYS